MNAPPRLHLQAAHALWKMLPPFSGAVPRGRFYFWASTPLRRPRSVQPARPGTPAPHPFSAAHAILPDLFPGPAVLLEQADYETLEISIPEKEGRGAVPSTVDAFAFGAAEAADFLTSPLPAGCPLSPGFAVLREAALWMLDLIERGHVQPDLRPAEKDGEFSLMAFWRLGWPAEAEGRLESFAASLPEQLKANLPAGIRPAAFIRHFMDCLADGWMRAHGGLGAEVFYASIPEQWLKALAVPAEKGRPPRAVSGPRSELEEFSRELGRRLGFETGSAYRVSFRLWEPETHEGKWRLEFVLQSLEDSAKVIPAASVWGRDGESLARLAAGGLARPDEFLLAALARAAVFCPPVAQALTVRAPSQAVLTGREAYLFLTQQSLLFKARGFGVIVPAWWHQKKKRFALRLRIKPQTCVTVKSPAPEFSASGLSGMQGFLDYDWDILAGGSVLTMEELEPLVRLKTPLLKINGEWMELRLQEIENLERYFQALKQTGARRPPVGEVFHQALEGETSEAGLPVAAMTGEGWVEGWLRQMSGGEEPAKIEVPESFQGKLRPYQQRGLSWLAFLLRWGFGACLADDMGLGKTVQVIALMLHLREKENAALGGLPFLLVCPMSIVGNWRRELERFAPSLKVFIHHGVERAQGTSFAAETAGADVVITTYSLAYRDQQTLSAREWGLVLLDEAQNIKNEEALQTKAVKSFRARGRAALTGTPVENRVTELWSIMDFLNPGYLGNFESFRTAFQSPIEKRLDTRRLEALRRRTAPFILRRLKSDRSIIRDLPEKMEMKVYCNLTREQASLYRIVAEEMMAKIRETSGIQRKGLVFSAITKLKQVCNHPVHYEGEPGLLAGRSGKLIRLGEMLEEVREEGARALVFTQYVEMGRLLVEALEEKLEEKPLFLHGGLSMQERDGLVEAFQKDPKAPGVLILSVKAGGSGLNLTAASHVFHFDRWWNPAVEDQATDRAYRIGQQKAVQVHKFLCAGTLEEKIDRMIERKRVIADAVISSGEEFLTEISDEELREILKLEDDAVSE